MSLKSQGSNTSNTSNKKSWWQELVDSTKELIAENKAIQESYNTNKQANKQNNTSTNSNFLQDLVDTTKETISENKAIQNSYSNSNAKTTTNKESIGSKINSWLEKYLTTQGVASLSDTSAYKQASQKLDSAFSNDGSVGSSLFTPDSVSIANTIEQKGVEDQKKSTEKLLTGQSSKGYTMNQDTIDSFGAYLDKNGNKVDTDYVNSLYNTTNTQQEELNTKAQNLNAQYTSGALSYEDYVNQYQTLETEQNSIDKNKKELNNIQYKSGNDYYTWLKENGTEDEIRSFEREVSSYDDSMMEALTNQFLAASLDFANTPSRTYDMLKAYVTDDKDAMIGDQSSSNKVDIFTDELRAYSLNGKNDSGIRYYSIQTIGAVMPMVIDTIAAVCTGDVIGIGAGAMDVFSNAYVDTMFGLQSAGDTMTQRLKEGNTVGTSFYNGVAHGVISGLVEAFNVGNVTNLTHLLTGAGGTVMGVGLMSLPNYLQKGLDLVQSGIGEGFEEIVEYAADNIADWMTNTILNWSNSDEQVSTETSILDSSAWGGISDGGLTEQAIIAFGSAVLMEGGTNVLNGNIRTDINSAKKYKAAGEAKVYWTSARDYFIANNQTQEANQAQAAIDLIDQERQTFATKNQWTMAMDFDNGEVTPAPSVQDVMNMNLNAFKLDVDDSIEQATKNRDKAIDLYAQLENELVNRGMYSIDQETGDTNGVDLETYLQMSPKERLATKKILNFATQNGAKVKIDDSFTYIDKDGKVVNKTLSNKETGVHLDNDRIILNPNSIDITTDGSKAMISTFAHELTHVSEKSELYLDLVKSVKNALGSNWKTELAKNEELYKGRNANAEKETIAKYIEHNIANENFMTTLSRYNDGALFTKAYLGMKSLLDFDPNSKVANQFFKTYNDAINKAMESPIMTNVFGDRLSSVNAQMNISQYKERGRDILKNYLDKQVAKDSIKQEEADNIINTLDYYADMIDNMANNPDYAFKHFANWSNVSMSVDHDGYAQLTCVVKNGEYALNIDFSTVCKKRKISDAVFNQLAKAGVLDGQALTQEQIATMRQIVKDNGFEVACSLCFVDSKRYNQGGWADTLLNGTYKTSKKGKVTHKYGWNELIDLITPEGVQVDTFNFAGREKASIEGTTLDQLSLEELDQKGLKKLQKLAVNKKGEKSSSEVGKMANAILNNPELRKKMELGDLYGSEAFGNIKKGNQELFKIVNSHQGVAKPKSPYVEVTYNNEILTQKGFNPDAAKYVGGVRLQSFSDYMANMVFDYMEAIAEMDAKGLTAHSYTKVKDYALLFGQTGIKINLSIIPKATVLTSTEFLKLSEDEKAKVREYAGLEKFTLEEVENMSKKERTKLEKERGLSLSQDKSCYTAYIFEDESFDWLDALEIQDMEGYSNNVGTICVGVSDEHIWKMLADDNVKMVIPYHKSSLNHTVATMMNIGAYNDYTDYQNTRVLDTDGSWKSINSKKFSDKDDFNFYEGETGMVANGYDARTVARNYLTFCAENGYLPKFDQFAYVEKGEHQGDWVKNANGSYKYVGENQGNLAINENYYKVLIDFKAYDKGNVAPQNNVRLNFPSNFGTILKSSLETYEANMDNQDEKIPSVVEQVKHELSKEPEEQYNLSENSDGDHLTNGQAEYFKDSKARDDFDRLMKWYHGSTNPNIKEFGDNTVLDAYGNIANPNGVTYLTSRKEIAKSYAGNINEINPYNDVDLSINGINEKLEKQILDGHKADAKIFKLSTKHFDGYYIVGKKSDIANLLTANDISEYYDVMDAIEDYPYEELDGVDEDNLSDEDFEKYIGQGLWYLGKTEDEVKQEMVQTDLYGGVYEMYANATNPYTIDGIGENWNSLPRYYVDQRYNGLNNLGDWQQLLDDTGLNKIYHIDKEMEDDDKLYAILDKNGDVRVELPLDDTNTNIIQYEENPDYYVEQFLNYVVDNPTIEMSNESKEKLYGLVTDIGGKNGNGLMNYASTRDWENYIFKNHPEYDSIRINNITDAGKFGTGNEYHDEDRSDILIVKNGNQVKSIYNENPTDSNDVRYDVSEKAIEDYNQAVANNDTQKAQETVDEIVDKQFANSKIRDEEGKLIKVYHGTMDDFNVFDRTKSRANMDIQGNFFSPWEDDAKGYGTNVRAFYLNIVNPASEQIGYKALRMFQGQNGAGAKARDYLISQGYDGVNNHDEEYIAFYPEQIKSADAITYDDNGTAIPIEERFNNSNEDVRYDISDKEDNVGYHYGSKEIDPNYKSEYLWRRGGRSTGAFGTGFYMFGDKQPFGEYSYNDGKNTEHKINLDSYNMFKPKDADQGFELHDYFKKLDDNFTDVDSKVWTLDEYNEVKDNLIDELSNKESLNQEELDAVIQQLSTIAEKKDVDNLIDQATVYDELVPQELAYQIEDKLDFDNNWNNSIKYMGYRADISDGIDYMAGVLGTDSETLKNVVLDSMKSAKEDISNDMMSRTDSVGTRVMKALGYEGIDVRGIKGLDNSRYGSVIYDLNPETIEYDVSDKKPLDIKNEEIHQTSFADPTYNKVTNSDIREQVEKQQKENALDMMGLSDLTDEERDRISLDQTIDAMADAIAQGKKVTTDADPTDFQGQTEIIDNQEKQKKNQSIKEGVNKFLTKTTNKAKVIWDLARKTKNDNLYSDYNQFLNSQAQTNNKVNSKGGLVDILNEISESQRKDFEYYAYHCVNIDAAKRGKNVFPDYTSEQSQKIKDKFETEHPTWNATRQKLVNYEQSLTQMMVDSGLISQDLYKKWQEMYPNYLHVSRVMNDEETKDTNTKVKTSNKGVLKERVGGKQNLHSLYDALYEHTLQAYKSVNMNNFAQEYANASKLKVTNWNDLPHNVDNIQPTYNDMLKGVDNDNPKPTLVYYTNGDANVMEIPDEVYEVFQDHRVNNIVHSTLQSINNMRRNLITGMNPVFMITNPIKDVQDVFLKSKHPFATYANLPKAMIGLGMSMANTKTNNNVLNGAKSAADSWRSMGGGQNLMTEVHSKSKAYNYTIGLIEKANAYIESVPRLAEFMASLQNGRNITQAMYDSDRVTTNFKMGGEWTKMADRNGFTFLNASVEGLTELVQDYEGSYDKNGMKGVLGKMAVSTLITGIPLMIINHLMWKDDDDYDNLSDYIKDNYYIVGKVGDRFIRIPKGRVAAAYQSVIENVYESGQELVSDDSLDEKAKVMWENTIDAFEGVWDNIGVNNPFNNNIVAPLIQVAQNKTWYGDDLLSEYELKKDPSQQYDYTTDKFSKWVGANLNISPKKINYLLDQYGGALGDILLPMLTPKAETGLSDGTIGGTIASAIASPWVDKFSTDYVFKNQNVSDLFTLDTELSQQASKENASDESKIAAKYISAIKYEMYDLYGERSDIYNDESLTDAEKYQKARVVQQQIDALAKAGVDTYDQLDISGSYAEINGYGFVKDEDDGSWSKVSDETTEELNALGMTTDQKKDYYQIKDTVSENNKINTLQGYYEEIEEINKANYSDSIKEEKLANVYEKIANAKEKMSDEDIALADGNYNNKDLNFTAIIDSNLTDEQKNYTYNQFFSSNLNTYIDDLDADDNTKMFVKYLASIQTSDYDEDGNVISSSKAKKIVSVYRDYGVLDQILSYIDEYDLEPSVFGLNKTVYNSLTGKSSSSSSSSSSYIDKYGNLTKTAISKLNSILSSSSTSSESTILNNFIKELESITGEKVSTSYEDIKNEYIKKYGEFI